MLVNKFFTVLKKITEKKKNHLISPLGFEIILYFLYHTTKGKTQEEIANLLKIYDHSAIENLYQKIANLKNYYNHKININLKIKHKSLIKFNHQSISKIPEIGALDFIAEETNDIDSVFEIINEFDLKDLWKEEFEEPSEKYMIFTKEDEIDVAIPCIRQFTKNGSNKTKYLSHQGIEALQIPLQAGSLVMEVYVPKEESLDDFINRLSPGYLNQLSEHFDLPKYIEVILPAFKLNTSYNFKQADAFLDLHHLFNPSEDFDLLFEAPDDLCIKKIKQKNDIELSEKGIVAKSKTIFEGGIAGLSEWGEYVVFEADQPFFYLLRDLQNGLIFYMGTFIEEIKEKDSKSDQELSKLRQLKQLKHFKPYIYELSLRGKMFFCMYLLKVYITNNKIELSQKLKQIYDDILLFLCKQDPQIKKKLSTLDLLSTVRYGFKSESEYFSQEELEKLFKDYPIVFETFDTIAWLIKYQEDNGEDYPSFSTIEYFVRIIQEKFTQFPDIRILQTFVQKNERGQVGSILNESESALLNI